MEATAMGDSHYVLDILSADGETTSRTLQGDDVVIGRRKGEIIIDDSGASGRHAELRLLQDTVEVRDLGSTNGIVWSGAIVREPFHVAVGEAFQIGRTKFTVTAIHHPEPEPEPVEEEAEEATAFISATELGMEDAADKPVAQAPTPVTPTPAPVAQAPTPVTPTPAPVAQAPTPVTPTPAPVAQAPTPVTPTPAPVAQAPAPVAQAPAPATPTPAPVAQAPAPVTPPPVAQAPEEEDDEEEATAWMTVMEDDAPAAPGDAPAAPDDVIDWRNDAPTPTSPDDWADEPAQVAKAQPVTLMDHAPAATAASEVVQIDERRPNFQGEGGELFKLFFLQGLLVLVTFGIYTPWFICNVMTYLASRTVFGPTQNGWIYARFHGKGGALFVTFIRGYLLTFVTFGNLRGVVHLHYGALVPGAL